MNFRDALEHELQVQGISVAAVATASGVSKGAIYNILNGTTEEERIRPSTRHALARGCGKSLDIDPDGAHRFVNSAEESTSPATGEEVDVPGLRVSFVPGQPFLPDRHMAEVFNWLNRLEESGTLSGLGVVDRVYQKRTEFLSLVVENIGEKMTWVEFPLSIAFDEGPNETFTCRLPSAEAEGRLEVTIHLAGGPPYTLFLQDGRAGTAEEEMKLSTQASYRHRGPS